MAEKFLADAGVAYTKIYADDAADQAHKFGVKQAPTLIYISNGTVMKIENVSNIRRFIESIKK